jgi:ergothioneine biosynthesis protein EgtB
MRMTPDPRPDVFPVPARQEQRDHAALATIFQQARVRTEELCQPLQIEDYQVQSMPDASPAKWHLAHTTWFFETFVLTKYARAYRPLDPAYAYLFNSYYNAVGERWPRSSRGLLSRPTVNEVYAYRRAVDQRVLDLLAAATQAGQALAATVLLGIHHEQQHQELLLTDIKHAFGSNPLRPAYREPSPSGKRIAARPLSWSVHPAGVHWLGHSGDGFAFDNESPRHRVFVESFQLASRLVTTGEYLSFMEDGGYERPELWLADGWNARAAHGWQAPLYWERQGARWWLTTLRGVCPLTLDEPVCHVSYYEADSYARWAGARLPTEAEWHMAAQAHEVNGNFVENGHLHPVAAGRESECQLFGDAWEWTASPYTAYPGYRPDPGALGEYNGKFMCNQMVLKGGSCASPQSHIRASYRNFFPPDARWQFTGLRLARDA